MGAAHLGHRFKYILQDLCGKQYLDSSGKWTDDPGSAAEFATLEEAISAMDNSSVWCGRIVQQPGFDLGTAPGNDEERNTLLETLRRRFH
ncbi:MAG TPA: hypothetical protein VKY92_13395 [Verrucomicrobiae bacterium]|nr:hypothetical protein [Verrucomicrobiae bacterium]